MEPRFERFQHPSFSDVLLQLQHWGDAANPPLVLLHGGGANVHWWDHLASGLSRHFHVIALDFRGHGDSDYPEQLEVGGFNSDLEALCDHLGTTRLSLVGHSMGAQVALDHASRHPETQQIALLDLARGASRRSRRVARLALSLRRTYATREEAIDRYRVIPPSERIEAQLLRHIAEHSVRLEADGRWGFKFDPRWFTVPPRPAPELGQVSARVLLLRGEESSLLSPEGAAELIGELPRAELVNIPGAGHHVLLDQPGRTLAALTEFLDPTDP